jgi:hypothetical protein
MIIKHGLFYKLLGSYYLREDSGHVIEIVNLPGGCDDFLKLHVQIEGTWISGKLNPVLIGKLVR